MPEQRSRSKGKIRKTRQGARGAQKVKTGCLTCKPACSRCIKAGWKCEFAALPASSSPTMPFSPDAQQRPESENELRLLSSPTTHTPRFSPVVPLISNAEVNHLEYFHAVCATEFALYFELPIWESLILQYTAREPVLHHAAIAIACLTRTRYHPTSISARAPSTDLAFSIQQYSLAIRALHAQLARPTPVQSQKQNTELAALASIVFALVEFLLGMESQIEVHLRAGGAVLAELACGRESWVGSDSATGTLMGCDRLLCNAMAQLTAQVDLFRVFRFRGARL
ncbi:hypothetical protein BJX64DRAFT_274003 [Aspergillus heterothallicus]